MYEAPLGAPNTLSETTHPHQNIPPYIQDVFLFTRVLSSGY